MRSVLFLALLSTSALAQSQTSTSFDSATVSGLPARNIGSSMMSGRISALDARVIDGKTLLFVGAASGGIWKSTDGGTNFRPVFDDQPVQSIGDVVIDPNNPRTIWVGTGESWTRNSVSIGNGVYKSIDGGETWQHMGLAGTERIARVLVHPRDSNTVFVCAPGKLWSDSDERGVFKSTDAGKTWRKVLRGANLSTGCGGLSLDQQNPNRLFASTWDFRRKGWTFRSGGEGPEAKSGSALYVSDDAGEQWRELTPNNAKGLPAKPYGRIAVEVAPSDSNVVYAVIEGVRSALYYSADGGKTFEERDRSQMMVWRPFYFSRLIVDPSNAQRVYKTNLHLIVSDDGGKSFSDASGGSHADWHALWINPANAKHLIGGDDGGMWTSIDGAVRWWKSFNLPISQYYHVSVDNADPYNVYGGLQDNSSWIGPSASPGGIEPSDFENKYGGDGFWMFEDPSDANYVYAEYQGGNISRIHKLTHESRNIQPTASMGEKLRFNWNTPIHLSPNEKGTLYIGAQYLFRSRDQGSSWERISPDLTTNDKNKQQQELSGGITVDNSSAEMHTTIYSISESPKDNKVIWVGTDDGNLQITRNGGSSWSNVIGQIKGLPKHSWVSWVEASSHDAATAFVAFDRHTFGDHKPYLYVTRNYGQSFEPLVLPTHAVVDGYAHVVRQDPVKSELLYLGTEFGLFLSIDSGQTWAKYTGSNFPNVAVRDLVIHPRTHDLVVGTHGRGIWIIDDISPLRALSAELLAQEAAFLPIKPQKQDIMGFGGWSNGDAQYVGPNPPDGAVITYYQRTRHLFGKLKLEILDAEGKVLKSLPAAKRRGLNRVVWDMRLDPPRVPKAAQLAGAGTQGIRVLPGRYQARLSKDGKAITRDFEVVLDPRAPFNLEDRKAQFVAATKVHALFGTMTELVDEVTQLRDGATLRAADPKAKGSLSKQLRDFSEQADGIRKQIVATKEGGAITGEERLREHVDGLYGAINSWEGKPGSYHLARIEVLTAELSEIRGKFEQLKAKAMPKLSAGLKRAQLEQLRYLARFERPSGVPLAFAADYLNWQWRLATGQSLPKIHRKTRR
jgi:photosystem II stability/assembly factor-like uncharacterized protein